MQHAREARVCFGFTFKGECSCGKYNGSGVCYYRRPAGDEEMKKLISSQEFWSAIGVWRSWVSTKAKGTGAAEGDTQGTGAAGGAGI